MWNLQVSSLLAALLPKESFQKSGRYIIVGIGVSFIFLGYILISFLFFDYLGQIWLIIGIFGIYFRKKKNFWSGRKSEEKEGIEQKGLNGMNVKFLLQKYVFYIITIVGIIFITIFTLNYLIFINFFINDTLRFYLMVLYFGDFFVIIGLLSLYFKKKKAYKLELESKYPKSETKRETLD